MKRAANITAAIACVLWGLMLWLGRDLTYGIYRHGPGVFPVAGRIDGLIVVPAACIILVMAAAWVVNAVNRWFAGLVMLGLLTLGALLVDLFTLGGGV